jgi:hypothetical protein
MNDAHAATTTTTSGLDDDRVTYFFGYRNYFFGVFWQYLWYDKEFLFCLMKTLTLLFFYFILWIHF